MLGLVKVNKLMDLLSKDIESQLCPVYHIVNPQTKEEEFQLTPSHDWAPMLIRVRNERIYTAESAIRGTLGRLERQGYLVASRMEELCQLKEN